MKHKDKHSDSLVQLVSQGTVVICKSHCVRFGKEVRKGPDVVER